MDLISCQIMPLVSNSLGGGHTHTNTHTHPDVCTETVLRNRGTMAYGMPGLASSSTIKGTKQISIPESGPVLLTLTSQDTSYSPSLATNV